MKKKSTHFRAAALLLCFIPVAVSAQEQSGIALGQFRILPTLGLTYGHDDNVVLTNSEQIESYFYVISPGVKLELPSDRSITTLTIAGDLGRYKDSPIDDYDDLYIGLDWNWEPSTRHDLTAYTFWDRGHDARGMGSRQGDQALLPIPPDEFELTSLGGSWTYGGIAARGRLKLGASVSDREYVNNREFTRYRDYRSDTLEASFFWRIGSKTRLGVGAEWDRFEYGEQRDDLGSLDSDGEYFYVGFEWDVSARTSGRVDVGKHTKDFEDPFREDYDGSFWRASVEWHPRTYSAFSLSGGRRTQETDGFGDYILVEDISIDWNHAWSERFSTAAEIGWSDEQHRPDTRDDDLDWWGVSARWQFSKHLQLGFGWQHYSRESDIDQYNYDNEVWTLSLEASL